jgi:hypothetical protein
MNHKRKQKFVDTNVQGALLRRILFHWVAFFFVTALTVILMKTLVGDMNISFTENVKNSIGEFSLYGVILLCLFPVFMLDTVRFSNRFVGPIGRLRRHLKELGTEKTTQKCAFRDNDFWAEMAEEFNKVVELVEVQEAEIARLKGQLNNSGITSRN